jgi:SHS2 domain-containing protein
MFRWIERGDQLELELESESEDGVFIDALEAVRELLEEDTGAGLGDRAETRVFATGDDRAALLADWLRQLAALAEGEGFVPQRISALELRDDGLTATVEGACGTPAHLVRAISDDGLVYEPAPESHRFHARAVLTTQGEAAGAGS